VWAKAIAKTGLIWLNLLRPVVERGPGVFHETECDPDAFPCLGAYEFIFFKRNPDFRRLHVHSQGSRVKEPCDSILWFSRQFPHISYAGERTPNFEDRGWNLAIIRNLEMARRSFLRRILLAASIANQKPRPFDVYQSSGTNLGSIGRFLGSLTLADNGPQTSNADNRSYDANRNERPVRPRWWSERVAPIVRFWFGIPAYCSGLWLAYLTGSGCRWRWWQLWSGLAFGLVAIGMIAMCDPMGW